MSNNLYEDINEDITVSRSEEKTTTKKVKTGLSFGKKNQESYFSGFAKGNIPKPEISKKDLVIYGVWTFLILGAYIAYSTDVYNKIKEIPKLEKNIIILKQNIAKQENEKTALEEMTIEDDELGMKENEILRFLPQENENVLMQQAFQLLEIAKASNISFSTMQIIPEEMTEDKIAGKDQIFSELGLDNFYHDVGINKFILSADASEEAILEFQRRIEESIGFTFQGFTIANSNEGMKYSLTLLGIYSLTK